jgi:magnesium-transporting ATPase (P-type)
MTIQKARIVLSATWIGGTVPLLLLVALETFLQAFGKGIGWDKITVWYLNLVLPILGTIVGSWQVEKEDGGNEKVSSSAVFWMTFTLMVLYLAILWMAFVVATFKYENNSDDWDYIIQSSGWLLAVLQVTISAVLAKFFIESFQSGPNRVSRTRKHNA